MTTSPRPRPDLAPTSGATSPGDLAPRPPLLRRGAKSRGELDTPQTNHTTSPQGRSHGHTPGRPCNPHDHCPTCHLLLAAEVARITGDAPGVMTILCGPPARLARPAS